MYIIKWTTHNISCDALSERQYNALLSGNNIFIYYLFIDFVLLNLYAQN